MVQVTGKIPLPVTRSQLPGFLIESVVLGADYKFQATGNSFQDVPDKPDCPCFILNFKPCNL